MYLLQSLNIIHRGNQYKLKRINILCYACAKLNCLPINKSISNILNLKVAVLTY